MPNTWPRVCLDGIVVSGVHYGARAEQGDGVVCRVLVAGLVKDDNDGGNVVPE